MVCTTFFTGPQNQPTGDSEIDELMSDIRAVTGRNWQVEVREYSYRRFWQLKTTTVKHYDLLLEVGGFPNWQLILSASGRRERLVAYLVGYMGSWADAKKLQPPVEFSLSNPELHLIRQWFGSVQDTNTEFLQVDDYVLAQKLYERLGLRVPESIKAGKVKKNYTNPWSTSKGFMDLGSCELENSQYDLYAIDGLYHRNYTEFTLGARHGNGPDEYLSGQTISTYGKYDVLVASKVKGALKVATVRLIKDHIKQPVFDDHYPNKLLFDAAGTPQY